jgi:uncharacterized damage-inducible protein DinB
MGDDDFDGRPRAPRTGSEREVLDGWLDFHRATLLVKCEGLTFEQLKSRPIGFTSLSLLGLVRHMTEVERGWFLPFVGEPVTELYCTEADPDADFGGVDDADAAADLARYGEAVDAINDLLRRRSLDEVEVDEGKSFNLRWIMTHMIEEYARHNGHADLLREAIDGVTGD